MRSASRDFAPPAAGEPHAAAIRRAADAGAYLVFLHPGSTNFLDFDRLPAELLDAVETYNHNSAVVWPDQGEARYAVDALLRVDIDSTWPPAMTRTSSILGPVRRVGAGPRRAARARRAAGRTEGR